MTSRRARPPTAREQAAALADELLGRRPERVEPFDPPTGGDDSHSFRLWDRGRPLVLMSLAVRPLARPAFPLDRLQGADGQ